MHFLCLSSHFWKAVVNADIGSVLQTRSHLVQTLSSLMWTPKIAAFTVGRSQKSAGARSGEYGAWGRVLMFLLSKKSKVSLAVPLSSDHFGLFVSKNA